MKVEIFWYFEILKIRSDDVIILRSVKTAILEENQNKIRTTIVAIAIITRIVIEKRQQIAELAETATSWNYCVATIVARPFTTTVKGRRQPSGRKIRTLFPQIQESGGVSGVELKLFDIKF